MPIPNVITPQNMTDNGATIVRFFANGSATGRESGRAPYPYSLQRREHKTPGVQHIIIDQSALQLFAHSLTVAGVLREEGRKEVLLPDGAPQQKRAGVRTTVPRIHLH